MKLGSRSLFRELGMALGLVVSLSAILHRASAQPATDEGVKAVPTSSMSFSELQQAVLALPEGDESPARFIEEWVAGRDLSELSIEDIRWCLVHSLPNEPDRHAFTVTWTGLLKAPRTGSYVFSVSPINVNGVGRNATRQTIAVTVANDEVLNTGAESPAPTPPGDAKSGNSKAKSRRPALAIAAPWNWQGTPIELQANRAVPVTVVQTYQSDAADEASPPSAILCWEGPGLARQLVGESFFSVPEGAAGGLKAHYEWKDAQGSPQSLVQDAPNIDYAWTSAARIAPARPKLITQLVDRLWLLATEARYLQSCAAGEHVHVFFQDYVSTEYLSTARRQQFLDLLVERPELLARADDEAVLRLYQKLRFGAEEAALDMLGHWMQLHADVTPEIAADFFQANREAYWRLGTLMARQLPEQLDRLRDDYLTMDDERCALLVAYTLSYGYQMADRMTPRSMEELENQVIVTSRRQDWIELLTEKSADESLSDPIRINWLLARAQAAETMSGSPTHEDYLAGVEWLKEAHLMPANQDQYVSVHREEIARLAAMNRESQVKEQLEKLANDVPTEAVQFLKAQTENVFKQFKLRQQETQRLTKAAYVNALVRRRDRALAKNDEASVTRYDSLLGTSDDESP